MSNERADRRTPAWVRILLAVSLALNLAVAGVALGMMVRFGGGPPRGGVDFALPYVKALERSDRRAIFGEVRQRMPEAGLGRAARQAHYAEIVAALRAQPFDRSALQKLVSVQAEQAKSAQGAAQAAWLELVTGMDDAERAAYADRVAEAVQRRGKAR